MRSKLRWDSLRIFIINTHLFKERHFVALLLVVVQQICRR